MERLKKEQENFFNIISRIINSDKLSHSYLIEINDYDTDFDYVKTFIKMILCKTNNLDDNLSDDKKKICNLVDTNNYPDLKVIDVDGQWIKKNQLLELKDEYQNKSLLGNKRIYIIKNADKLNSSSANTILKFLEEPEENIIAILLTTNRYQVLETILSRCQVLSLMKNNSNIEISDNDIELLKFIVNKDDLFVNYKYIVEEILTDKKEANNIISNIENILIEYLDYRILKINDFNIEVSKILDSVDINKIIKIVLIIEKEVPNLVYNVNYKIWLDSLFSKFVEV